MESYRSEIGSLATVFSFEAAARLGSFTAAAAELNVSQAAVSKQIAMLEERLGATLFQRKHRHVVLTREGQRLYAAANSGLASIAGTMREIRQTNHRPLTIALSLALTRFWLMPILPEFTRQHPEIPVRILSTDDPTLSPIMGIDLVIRYESGAVPEPNAIRLFFADVCAMASPRFADKYPMVTPDDVLSGPRISYDTPGHGWITWHDWCRIADVDRRVPEPTLSVTSYHDACMAAHQDQGVALIWNFVGLDRGVHDELYRVPGPTIRVPGAFYLIAGSDPTTETKHMISWLKSRMLTTSDAATADSKSCGTAHVEHNPTSYL